MRRGSLAVLLGAGLLTALSHATVRADQFYVQTNLITIATDSDLINPWGISSSAGGPLLGVGQWNRQVHAL